MTLRFELHQLGWFSFEQLCRTICREVYDQPVQAFAPGHDGGRDGALFGPWHLDGELAPAVLQCKHSGKVYSRLTPSDVELELPKIRRHVEAGRCNVYLLMTNKRVSAVAAAKIEDQVRSVGVDRVVVHGYEAICELLAEHKQLRARVPRLYGLGDLTEILDERAYAQAEAVLATMHDDLSRIVPVAAHRLAHQSLADHQFTLLLGRPGSGKTSIAASLAVGAIDLYGVRVIKLTRPAELADRWNPNDPQQLFWLDDAFGATSFDHSTAEEWNRVTPLVEAALKRGAHMVVTSRDYVYAAAKDHLKASGLPRIHEATVVIEVEDFTTVERRQILYNHLRLGGQPRSFLEQLRPKLLETVADHENFLPEIARRIAEPVFTAHVRPPVDDALLDFVRRPADYLREVLVGLDIPTRAALGLVHLRGGNLPSPYEAAPGDEEFLARVGASLSACLGALPKLNSNLLRLVSRAGERWWEFHHPSLTDAYRTWLAGEPELLREYLTSTPAVELVRAVTCGDLGLAGVIVVPRPLQHIVVNRLIESRPIRYAWNAGPARQQWERMAWSFLAHRCDDEFLRSWLEHDPDTLLDTFNVGVYLDAHTTERDLAARLLSAGIAHDAQRGGIVAELRECALNVSDASFLADSSWLQFFTDEELASLDHEIRTEVLPNITDLILGELLSFGSKHDPSEELSATLDALEQRFPDWSDEIHAAREAVTDHRYSTGENRTASKEWNANPGFRRAVTATESRGSIFDDLIDDLC